MKSSSPTTTIRCFWSENSSSKTGGWHYSTRDSFGCWPKGYGRRIRPETVLHGWRYYAVSVVIFGIGAALCIAGMRGGITRQTRPITLSNATLYTPESNKANLLLSNPFCILRTMSSGGKIHYVKYFADDELPQYFTPTHQPAEHPAVDLSGRNVMIFIMESMSAEHSALLHPELYPAKGGVRQGSRNSLIP